MTALFAMTLAGLAAALAVGAGPDPLRSRLGLEHVVRPRSEQRRRVEWAGAGAVVLGVALLAGPAVGVVGVGVAALMAGLRDRRATARRRRQRESDVVDACLALASDLRAGGPARQALEAVSADWPDLLGQAAGRAAVGADVPSALREAARAQGAEALGAVAAGWEVSERTGAPLSRVLVAVADSLRSDAAVRREAEAQLATVRATSRLLALLPAGTLLLLSGGGGGGPFEFLTGSSYGLACLGAAVALVGSGLWWIDRLARTAVPSWHR